MSDFYGPADDAESVATIQAAVGAGVTLLDTGDYYGMGHNELLLRGRDREAVQLALARLRCAVSALAGAHGGAGRGSRGRREAAHDEREDVVHGGA